jgi:hypothetical protein
MQQEEYSMGKIPRFESERLASEVVGVPSQDRSGVIIGASVGRATAQAANVIAKTNRERQDILDIAETTKASAEFNTEYTETIEQSKKDFRNNPKDILKFSQETGLQLMNAKMETLTTLNSKKQFASLSGAQIRNQTAQLNRWRYDQETTNAVLDYKQAADALAIQAGNSLTVEELGENLEKIELMKHPASFVFGKGTQQFIETQKKQAVENYVFNRSFSAPEQVLEEIESGVFDNIIGGEDKFKMLSNIADVSDQQDALAEQQVKDIQEQNNFNFVAKIQGQGTVTVQEIVSAVELQKISTKDGINLIKSIKSSETQSNNPYVLAELNTQLQQGTLTTSAVIAAEAEGQIKKAVRDKYIGYLTSNLKNNPSIQRAYRTIKAEFDLRFFGQMLPKDQQDFARAIDELYEIALTGKKSVPEITKDILKKLKEERFLDTNSRRYFKVSDFDKVTLEMLEKKEKEILDLSRKKLITQEEAESQANDLERIRSFLGG